MHMHVPNNFKIHSHGRTEQFLIRMRSRAQSNYQTIFDSNENQSIGCYAVITDITQVSQGISEQSGISELALHSYKEYDVDS